MPEKDLSSKIRINTILLSIDLLLESQEEELLLKSSQPLFKETEFLLLLIHKNLEDSVLPLD
jgi:hypothetical protein